MRTRLAIDEKLLQEAMQLGKHETKNDAVRAALAEYIKYKQRSTNLEISRSSEMKTAFDDKAKGKRFSK